MKGLDVGRDRSVLFAPIDLYRPRFPQLDGDDARRRVGAEQELIFLECHSGTTTSGRANQGRRSAHAAIASPANARHFARLHLGFEMPVADPGAWIVTG